MDLMLNCWWDGVPKRGYSRWRLGLTNGIRLILPCDQRLVELATKYMPGHSCTVQERYDTICMLELSAGTTKKIREAFKEAVKAESWMELEYALLIANEKEVRLLVNKASKRLGNVGRTRVSRHLSS